MASIWRQNMLRYFTSVFIGSESFEKQIVSKDKYPTLFFSEASQRSGILNSRIWLANSARSSGPDFSNIAAILAAFCYTKDLHEM